MVMSFSDFKELYNKHSMKLINESGSDATIEKNYKIYKHMQEAMNDECNIGFRLKDNEIAMRCEFSS